MKYFRMLMLVGCLMAAGVWSSCVGDAEMQTCGSSLIQTRGSVEKQSARNVATVDETSFRPSRDFETLKSETLAMPQAATDKGNSSVWPFSGSWECYMSVQYPIVNNVEHTMGKITV